MAVHTGGICLSVFSNSLPQRLRPDQALLFQGSHLWRRRRRIEEDPIQHPSASPYRVRVGPVGVHLHEQGLRENAAEWTAFRQLHFYKLAVTNVAAYTIELRQSRI